MGYSHDVYQTIIEQKLNHNSQNRPKSWAQLLSKKYRGIGCGHAVSIYLQRKGCLKTGELISHTKRTGKLKNTKSKAIVNHKKLSNCTFHYVNQKFAKLPREYKKAGIVYVYDSDIAVYQGNNIIYSCNNDGIQSWKKVKHTYGSYQFTHKILWVIIPPDIG